MKMKREKHGHTWGGGKRSPTYTSWASMKYRCTNRRHNHYNIYGGRGISFCDRWKYFSNFLEDMGERPRGKTLDRIDNNGNYCKENCRWSTSKEQCRNKSNNVYINGVVLSEFCEQHNINDQMVSMRIKNGCIGEDVIRPVNTASDKFYKRETIKRNGEKIIYSKILMDEFKKSVTKLKIYLGVLDDRERDIIRMRFGLIDGNKATLEEVGKKYHISRERVRQIEDKAMKTMMEAQRGIEN